MITELLTRKIPQQEEDASTALYIYKIEQKDTFLMFSRHKTYIKLSYMDNDVTAVQYVCLDARDTKVLAASHILK